MSFGLVTNPFGGTNDLVKMNPPIESPNLIEPAGPTDPEVTVVSLQSPDGRPIALLADYSLHYVGTSHDEEISADYYGAFADRIQQVLGAGRHDPPFIALLANGTSGDINNLNLARLLQLPRSPSRLQNPRHRDGALCEAARNGPPIFTNLPTRRCLMKFLKMPS